MRKKQQEGDIKIEADWRSQALETLPELSEEIKAADNPMYLWIEICLRFQRAYEAPQNDDLIRRIYGFAGWCLQQSRDSRAEYDLFTCVIVGFYEDIPAIKAARADMPRWFSLEKVQQNEKVFSYHLTEGEYKELLTLYVPVKAKYGTRRRTPQ